MHNAATRQERPIRPHSLTKETKATHNAWIIMPSRGNQPPQPGQGWRQNMEDPGDPIGRVLLCTGWHPYPKTADINADRTINNIRNKTTRQNNPRIGASFTIGIQCMFPQKRCRPGNSLQVNEDQRFFWMQTKFLQMRICAILRNMIDPDKPCILCIRNNQFRIFLLMF